MLKKLNVLIIFVLLIISPARSTHLIGGELYYEYLGGNNYAIHLLLYRDCQSTGAMFDNPVKLGIYNENNNLIEVLSISQQNNPTYIPYNLPCDTLPSPPLDCKESLIYDTIINLPSNTGGYTITYQRCCFNSNIVNVINTEDFGFTLSTHINGVNSIWANNSSPHFIENTPFVFCLGDSLTYNNIAIDLDGDSLVYSIDSTWKGASPLSPQPTTPTPPPYLSSFWDTGFSNSFPLGVQSTFYFDSIGNITIIPQVIGEFLLTLKVKELRNGILIGEYRKIISILVVNPITNSISEGKKGSNFDYFPNPFQESFNLVNAQNSLLIVTNSNGKRIFKQNIESNNTEIDMRDFKPGIYFLHIYFEENHSIKRIIKN